MKNTIKLSSLLLTLAFLFSSCQAVYEAPLTPPETTANPEIDLNDEYYTTGVPYYTGDIYSGMLYEGCLIYIEQITTIGVTGYSISPSGVKTDRYGEIEVARIVKYNPVTETVSSPCLDPVCNHSLESGCPMLLGYGVSANEMYRFKGIFGDWLIYMIHKQDDEYSVLNTEIMYNLKTGECRRVYSDDLGSEVLSRWDAGQYFDGKYYKVNTIMDYSETGYRPGSGKNASHYVPKTKQFLYEYDFETDTSKMLFEIGDDWNLGKVSNERFYYRDSTGKHLSTKKDGSDKRKEASVGKSNVVGTYTIYYNSKGYTVHDLKTDEVKEFIFDYPIVGKISVTEKGILSATQTKLEEKKNFSSQAYREQHPDATSKEINNYLRKLLSSGSAQIWQCDYMGDNNHLIFELPAAQIELISASGDFVFAKVSKYNTETGEIVEGFNVTPCCINIVTGEVTPIPELDIVVPYWYVK